MFRQLVLWWRIRQAEKELKSLRECQRKNPADPGPKERIPLLEDRYDRMRAEEIFRHLGWHFTFLCDFCARRNTVHCKPIACQFCGKDAPADVQATNPKANPG